MKRKWIVIKNIIPLKNIKRTKHARLHYARKIHSFAFSFQYELLRI